MALVLVAVLGFAEPHRSLGEVVLHPAAPGPGGVIAPASLALLGAATAAGIYAFNGYGSVVFLGEEMHEAPKRIARVVFLALGVAALTELLPVLAVLIGAKNIPALLAAKAPIAAFIAETGGPVLAKVMSAGVALAIFNSMIAVALMGGRQLYSTGRDGFWTERLNTAFATIDPAAGIAVGRYRDGGGGGAGRVPYRSYRDRDPARQRQCGDIRRALRSGDRGAKVWCDPPHRLQDARCSPWRRSRRFSRWWRWSGSTCMTRTGPRA